MQPISAFRTYISTEAAGGITLMVSAAIALLVANSPWAGIYFGALESYLGGLSILHWVNDVLMTLFFLLVGLEIKRELLVGNLRTWPDRFLPAMAAIGGMAVPALVYLAVSGTSTGAAHGWAIPTATDIAFALGVLALLGPRVPVSLKIFLTALAILDDLGAVLVIAFFYTASLSWPMLIGAAVLMAALYLLNRAGVRNLTPYVAIGVLLWFCIFKSGVHATLAGVLLALAIPLRTGTDTTHSPLLTLEHGLSPWVAFLVLPLFGFANAGVSLTGFNPQYLTQPVTLGILLGLLVGKQVGVFGAIWFTVKTGLAPKPANATWRQLYGISLLCGIGFTMSLFIGLLAFASSPILINETKIGVLIGSILCAALGALILKASQPKT